MTAPELKPCPFCGGEATTSPAIVDRQTLYAHCKDHTCQGWTVSRCPPVRWNRRADLAAVQPAQVRVSDILKAAGEEYVLEHVMETDDHRMGRKSTVRGMMVRLGLYPELEGAIDAALEPQPDPRDEVIKGLIAAVHNCVGMLDQLIAESGRLVEWDAEDPFRMGEWFEPEDLAQIESARAALAAAKAVQK